MKPGGQGRFGPEGIDLAVELKKGFLSQIFCLRYATNHAQTEGIHMLLVYRVKLRESLVVASLGAHHNVGLVVVVCGIGPNAFCGCINGIR